MSIHQPLVTLAAYEVSLTLLDRRTRRSFDLHPALFAATLGGFLVYLAVMAVTFMTPELIIPFAIFFITIVAAFAVPALWTRVDGPKIGRMPDWHAFLHDGIDTGSGHLSGRSAAIQVLIMPAMLVAWGLIVALICAIG